MKAIISCRLIKTSVTAFLAIILFSGVKSYGQNIGNQISFGKKVSWNMPFNTNEFAKWLLATIGADHLDLTSLKTTIFTAWDTADLNFFQGDNVLLFNFEISISRGKQIYKAKCNEVYDALGMREILFDPGDCKWYDSQGHWIASGVLVYDVYAY